jgi:hypothetical protein
LERLKWQRVFYGEDTAVFSLNWRNVVDIDDLRMAEIFFCCGVQKKIKYVHREI